MQFSITFQFPQIFVIHQSVLNAFTSRNYKMSNNSHPSSSVMKQFTGIYYTKAQNIIENASLIKKLDQKLIKMRNEQEKIFNDKIVSMECCKMDDYNNYF